mmetsp:Transcript_69959/g.167939  ORF Transcript_69959/g.167939 Transcript_69959/m.167939 type:complete len:158 (+) Transcript_69959:110-583(+)|eukprot:CAMPEP_0178390788 /NCGR_PEP_ID=MMETSP0689_2-20121128/10827_1 /TAXON_ID=160604 /ORGANISM="Amphidinium massartii, Strain CS-259" /LENGTH=157 /DNA_ID=CAMNT_0020011309 /DNA_START=65 /DNA_END=538 /DNA_ORIENTATION=+
MGNQETCCCNDHRALHTTAVTVQHCEADAPDPNPRVAFAKAVLSSAAPPVKPEEKIQTPSKVEVLENFTADLEKGDRDLGLQIRMCVARRQVQISAVKPGSCAFDWNQRNPAKQLRPEQQILEINDHSVAGLTLQEIVKVISRHDRVKITVRGILTV